MNKSIKFFLLLGFLFLLIGFTAMSGCNDDDFACLFSDTCSQGTSYEGSYGERLCGYNGGEIVSSCPVTNCIGVCDIGTSNVYYYSAGYTVEEAEDKCDFLNGTFSTSCN